MSSPYKQALTLTEAFLAEEGWVQGKTRPNDSGYRGTQTLFKKNDLWFWIQDLHEWPSLTWNSWVGETKGWPEDVMIYHPSKGETPTVSKLKAFLNEKGIYTRGKVI